MRVVWQRWKRLVASIFVAQHDLKKKLLFAFIANSLEKANTFNVCVNIWSRASVNPSPRKTLGFGEFSVFVLPVEESSADGNEKGKQTSGNISSSVLRSQKVRVSSRWQRLHQRRGQQCRQGQQQQHLKQQRTRQVHVDRRHLLSNVRDRLIRGGNVETNPGPLQVCNPVTVTSYNVRGLKDESKLRHMLNLCHKGADSTSDFFYLMQETYLDKPGKIPYIWRGNYFLTPGEGHSGGCLTLMSNCINVVESKTLVNRAHVLACQKTGEDRIAYIVVNLYAPNPNSREKITFYEQLFELIDEMETRHNCQNIIMGGDFNLTFGNNEVKNRIRTTQEKRIAELVKISGGDLGLTDVWAAKSEFTWRRPNTDCFSCIDHVLYNKEKLELTMAKANWSLSFSDHAAVELVFKIKGEEPTVKTRVTRLDPYLVKNSETRFELERGFNEMWEQAQEGWDPHTRLEYAKMCIRTVGEKLQAERKRKEIGEEETVNKELNLAINKLERGCTCERDKRVLLDYVEELRARKEILIEEKGARLAEKLGSKWYNEGEKSTRYFLRLLNRRVPDKFGELINARNETIKTADEVEAEIVNFYKSLYENYDKTHLSNAEDDDSFFDNLSSVTDDDASDVTKPLTVAELRMTLHSCKDSAPGPDGIPYSYIGALWSTMGPLICEAWRHSQRIGKLCPSHRASFRRLIPKVGKDARRLTNWRPITLSNCDHKLITKTYANRVAEKVEKVIKARQTAYLKGRLINDNIRSIMLSVQMANLDDETIDGLLVSLDAKKAFDSVEHSYIEKCLAKFGLRDFIPIFRVLYKDLKSDILVNGKVVPGYLIKRGVKQGDALSCILFIMCMEPLIRNIEENNDIEQIQTIKLGVLPKAYSYADDLSCVIKNSVDSLQGVFDEYERLTRLAGLELNAEKTELMKFASQLRGRAPRAEVVEIRYLEENFQIETVSETKINGILFQQDQQQMRMRNVAQVRIKMEQQLKRWSRRSLSTLGKILIVKTFGISQAIFLMQSITLDKMHVKLLNETLYKFIWNKHFLAAKAPERVKREIVNTPLKRGGLGMLDISELDNGLKLRALGRLLSTEHPCLKLVKSKLDFSDFFFPNIVKDIDGFTERGIELLRQDRQLMWGDQNMLTDTKFLSAIRASKILNLVKPQFRNNVRIFMWHVGGVRKVEHLDMRKVDTLAAMLASDKILGGLRAAVSLRVPLFNEESSRLYYVNGRWDNLGKITSKTFREA